MENRYESLVRQPDAHNEQTTPAPTRSSAPDALTVLVAHADADLRVYVAQCLRTRRPPPARILEAATGAEALAHAPGADLIITDYLLQGRDGQYLHTTLAADAVLRNTPVLVLADLDPESFPAPDSPTVATVTMPFWARTLLTIVEALLRDG